MYLLNEKQQRPPFGGHQYFEYGVMFKGESYKEVVRKLTDFRRNNNLGVGDPEQDVLRHYAKNWPWTVKRDLEYEEPEPEDLHYANWRKWVTNAWRRPPSKYLTTKEATDRWSVCEKCPFNIKKGWAKTPESKELEKRVYILTRGLPTPTWLGYCRHHKCDLRAFTFFEKANGYSSTSEQAPANCWVKE